MFTNREVFCSIIVPIYNAEKYIEKCIDSILKQNHDLIELILINDGSTDGTGRICEQYEKEYEFVQLFTKENGGHTSARNAGLEAAKGKYIVFVDSDDWLEDNLIDDCYRIVCEHENPDMLLYGLYHIKDGEKIEKRQPYSEGYYAREDIERKILPDLLERGRFSVFERMMKQELIRENQKLVDKRIKIGEDLVSCVCAVSKAQSIYVMPQMYYNYYIHNDSISHLAKNYYYRDWTYVKEILDREVSNILPDYKKQLGVCSIRFLDRAVMGEIERNGLSLRNIRAIRKKLGEFHEELHNAVTPRRVLKVKLFCLRNKFVYLLCMANKLNGKIREIRK